MYFEFTNTGNALNILGAKSTCGCVVPSWPKDPIFPGKKGIITVTYDTKRTGPIKKSVTISSNAINSPKIDIKIKGSVEPIPKDTNVNTPRSPVGN